MAQPKREHIFPGVDTRAWFNRRPCDVDGDDHDAHVKKLGKPKRARRGFQVVFTHEVNALEHEEAPCGLQTWGRMRHTWRAAERAARRLAEVYGCLDAHIVPCRREAG